MSNSPFTPSSTDAAVGLLRSVFGPVVDKVITGDITGEATGAASMLAEAFRYFNGGVLFFGTLIITYVALFSVINTANDGEALGKRWSTLYTPLRTLVSTMMLIPTASGYAGIQLFILLVVSWSIGFASNMWSAVLTQVAQTNVVDQAMKSVTEDASFDALAMNALKMQLCAKGINKTVSQMMPSATPTNLTLTMSDKVTGTLDKQTRTTTITYKDKNWAGSENLCGRIIMSNVVNAPTSNSNSTADVERSIQAAIETVRKDYAMMLFSADGVILKVADYVMEVAETDGAKVSEAQINAAVVAIRKQMLAAIRANVTKQVSDQNSGVVAKLSEKGWIYAGSLSSELARMKDAIRNATASKSQFIEGNSNLEQQLSGDVLRAVVTAKAKYDMLGALVASKIIASPMEITKTATMPKIQTSFTANDFSSGGDGFQADFHSYFNQIGDAIVGGVVGYMNTDDDAVMQVKNVGDYLATSAQSAVVAKTLATVSLKGIQAASSASAFPGAAAVAGVATTVLSTVEELWSMVAPSVYSLMYIGYFLGIWLPMIPFYIFALGVVGWLVFVVEMMAAGVLWMAAHTTPAREDSFIGSQTQGYLLLMSGFFRPALMVLGLVASMAMLNPAVTYVNSAFLLSFRSLQADSTNGLVQIAGFLMVYGFIIFSVFMLCFSLPQTLPDRILKWIGGGVGDMGEQNSAGRVEQGASSQSRMAAMAMIQGAVKQREKNQANDDGKKSKGKEDAPEGHGGQSEITK